MRDLQRMDGITKITAAEQFRCERAAGKKQRCGNGEKERADIQVANQPAAKGSLFERFQINRLLEMVDKQFTPQSWQLN